MQDTQNANSSDWQGEQSSFNLKRIIGTVLSYWPRFVGSLIVALLIAFLYLRYTLPVYNIHAKMLILDDKSPGTVESNVFQGMGLINKRRSVDNEVEVLKSYTLMERVVKDLQLNVRFFTKGRIKSLEVFNSKPFTFNIIEYASDKQRFSYKIKPTESGFSLSSLDKTYSGKWNDTLNLPVGKVVISRCASSNVEWKKEDEYLISISPIDRKSVV